MGVKVQRAGVIFQKREGKSSTPKENRNLLGDRTIAPKESSVSKPHTLQPPPPAKKNISTTKRMLTRE